MRFKRGVNPKFLSAPMWYAMYIADTVHKVLEPEGREAWCTSTGEAEHSTDHSRHYAGEYGFGFSNAADLRTWYVDSNQYAKRLRSRLGSDYVVIVERTHIHVHWAPVYGDTTRDR